MIASIDRCPTCEQPTHASESDDSGRCDVCRAHALSRSGCSSSAFALGYFHGALDRRCATPGEAWNGLECADLATDSLSEDAFVCGSEDGALRDTWRLNIAWERCSAGLEGVTS